MTDTTSIDDLPGVPGSATQGSGIVQNQKPEIPAQTYNPTTATTNNCRIKYECQ